MTPIEPRPELDALLGAYVLDALEPDERALVEDYLDTHPRARAEVDDLRETTAVLAGAPVGDTTAPAELWARIAAEVEAGDDAAARADAADELATRRARKVSRPAMWIASAVAAAAVVLVALLAAQVVSLNDELDDERNPANVAAAYDRAADTEGARQADLVAQDGTLARVVMLPDGTGYLVNENMEPLSADETYQLWAIVGEGEAARVISAGVLGADPRGAPFKVDGPVTGLALTVENSPGVPVTANDPVAIGKFA